MNDNELPEVVVIGAGLSGALMAWYLGKRGFAVDVYERRPDLREGFAETGRSINLGLSQRGIRVLREIGLLDRLWPDTVPMRGRAIHRAEGEAFQPYGSADDQILHSIGRSTLNLRLIEHADAFDNVRFHFRTKFTGLEKSKGLVYLVNEATGANSIVECAAVLGADGVHSAVRKAVQRGEKADYRQEFLPWGYKELTIPPAADGSPVLRREAFHIWPSDAGMVIAQPNADNSFVGTVFLPLEGDGGFAARSPHEVRRFFDTHFPGAARVIPELEREFAENPVGELVTVRTYPWLYEDRVVLLGDACHAVYPFYGQGMNAAFEDCAELDACLGRHGNGLAAAFDEYQRRRKPHTDVLAELSSQHFAELRDRVRSPLFALWKRTDLVLAKAFPSWWKSLYTMVSHTSTPYADALARVRKQQRVLGVAAAAAAAAGLAVCLPRRSARRRSHSHRF